jgi:hypothetical protein
VLSPHSDRNIQFRFQKDAVMEHELLKLKQARSQLSDSSDPGELRNLLDGAIRLIEFLVHRIHRLQELQKSMAARLHSLLASIGRNLPSESLPEIGESDFLVFEPVGRAVNHNSRCPLCGVQVNRENRSSRFLSSGNEITFFHSACVGTTYKPITHERFQGEHYL